VAGDGLGNPLLPIGTLSRGIQQLAQRFEASLAVKSGGDRPDQVGGAAEIAGSVPGRIAGLGCRISAEVCRVIGKGEVPVPGPKYRKVFPFPAAMLACRLAIASLNSLRKPFSTMLRSFKLYVLYDCRLRVAMYRTSIAISGQMRPQKVQDVHSLPSWKMTKWYPFSLNSSERRMLFFGQVTIQS
jgi:hypothetical protein